MAVKPEEVELLKPRKEIRNTPANNVTPANTTPHTNNGINTINSEPPDKVIPSDDSNDTLTDGSTLIDMLQSVMV
jgi:hypothetical protein